MRLISRRLFVLEISMFPLFSRMASAWQESPSKLKKSAESDEGRFSIFEGKLDGHRLIAAIDTSLRDYKLKASLPWFLSISVPLINPNDDGLTTREDADALNKWEDTLEKQLAAQSHFAYVGRVTWNGHRELLFYIDKPDVVSRKLKSLISGHTTRPFTFHCERDEKWEKASIYFRAAS